MSDSRFHLKLQFSIYGKDYPWECSLNWCAEPGEIDGRIAEFFVTSHDDAFTEKLAKDVVASEKEIELALEERERAELQRLLKKYKIQ